MHSPLPRDNSTSYTAWLPIPPERPNGGGTVFTRTAGPTEAHPLTEPHDDTDTGETR